MLNQVKDYHEPFSWLKAFFLACLAVFILLPFDSFGQGNRPASAKEAYAEEPLPAPFPENGNTDLIVPLFGEEIKCVIDNVDKTSISYHIRQRGSDPTATIRISQVVRYYTSQRWYDAFIPDASLEKARNLLLSEKINEAVAHYSQLVLKDSTNAGLLAENAYALAIAGIYEAALIRLDRSWSVKSNSAYVNYFTGQVFKLMGYDDIASELWKSSEKFRPPFWIASKAPLFLEKYKTRNKIAAVKSKEELIDRFKLANELAAKDSYFQSIAIFHQIVDLYPNEFVPYIGYGITLEKTGALERSASTLEKAISLIGNNAEDLKQKQALEKHLQDVRLKLNSLPAGSLPGLTQIPFTDAFTPQVMGYAGGVATPTYINANLRFGYFIQETSNFALDLGVNRYDSTLYSNLGVSLYDRKGDFIYGTGVYLRAGGGSTSTFFKGSIGYRIMNMGRTSSLDVFLDVSSTLKSGAPLLIGLSVGQSLYFGKRK